MYHSPSSTTSMGGFTLLELLISIAIVGILAATLIPNLLNVRRTGLDTVLQVYTRNILTHVDLYLVGPANNLADLDGISCDAIPGTSNPLPNEVTSCTIYDGGATGVRIESTGVTGSTVLVASAVFTYNKNW
jgi:type IV pilus assembly protein PilA